LAASSLPPSDAAAHSSNQKVPALSLADAFDRHLEFAASPKKEQRREKAPTSVYRSESCKASPRVQKFSSEEPDHILIRQESEGVVAGSVEGSAAASSSKLPTPRIEVMDGSPQPPTLLTRRSDRKLTATSIWTATSVGARTHEEGSQKALVVNFRRLIEIKEKLDIIHEVIKATTIALLTLLAVQSGVHLLYDVVFLALGIALYSVHEMRHDTMDVDDFRRVVGLLGNDGDELLEDAQVVGRLENPNRCLQGLSFSRNGRRRLFSYLCVLFFVGLVAFSWGLTVCTWTLEYDWHSSLGISELPSNEELEHYVTLLLVGTVMLVCHVVFELIYLREFEYFMPLKNGVPWDVADDGMPAGNMNWLFGLPCVWFTSRAAYDDLRIWVTLAAHEGSVGSGKISRPTHRSQKVVSKVFSEELACFALEDQGCAARLRKCLLTSKLYDKNTKRFLRRVGDHEIAARSRPSVNVYFNRQSSKQGLEEFRQVDFSKGEMPAELSIELLFYDNRSSEVWIPKLSDEADNDGPLRLKHARSFLQDMLC